MQTAAGITQTDEVLIGNPAVAIERARLEHFALTELRRWAVMNPVERVFNFSLEQAARELVEFETRHGIEGDV